MTEENKYIFIPLPEPIPITEQNWPEGTLPLVHTRTMTFNHENYIRDCIEGILMQKTTFPVQVLIHDDASTDKTADIVKEYELKYPRLIKAYYQKENSYTKPDKLERRKEFGSWRIGKYEAICEGDDYWTDPLKLQKQVDFMEENPDCSICFHSTLMKKNSQNYVVHDYGTSNKIFESEELISGKISMLTASILVRTDVIINIPANLRKLKFGDVVVKLWAASKGCVAYVGGGPMSVYRRGITGAWSDKEGKDVSWEKERLDNHYEIVHVFKEILPIKYHKALDKYKDGIRRSYFYSLRKYYQGFEMVLVLMKNLKYINYNIFSPLGLLIKKKLSKLL